MNCNGLIYNNSILSSFTSPHINFAGNDYGDMTGTVAGWGQLSEISTTSLSLRHATLPIWSEKECSKVPEFKKTGFTANMLCAGLKEGGKDSCQVKRSKK